MAGLDEQRWHLQRQGRTVAELVLTGFDMPWLLCRVEPESNSGFDEVRSLTDAAEIALRAGDDNGCIRLLGALRRPGLRLVPMDGREPIESFFLWFEGESARLRF